MKCIEKSYINDYLDRSRALSPLTTLREMSDVESGVLGAIDKQKKELSKLLMELITISQLLKRFTIQVVGTPGEGFGKCGEGYFRFSAFGDPADTKTAMDRIERLLK